MPDTITHEANIGTPAARANGRTDGRVRWTRQKTVRVVRRTLLALGPLVLVAVGGYFYATGGRYVSIDNAYVQAAKLSLTTDVAGFVADVAVRDNDSVAAGQLLFRLDDAPYRIAIADIESQLATVANDIAAMKSSYRQKQQDIALARSNIDFMEREFKRKSDLMSGKVVSESQFDTARHNVETARSQLGSLREELSGIVANLGGNPDIAVENHPRYRALAAKLDQAKRDLDHTVVRAPTAGVVTNVPNLQRGQFLPAAQPAFSLVETGRVWIGANPKETDLTNVRPGQKVTVTIDTYPGIDWSGTVESLSPASGSEFSLLPAQNTSGNWIKVVQRIPIRIKLDQGEGKPPLRAGMSVVVDIDTGKTRGLPHWLEHLLGRDAAPVGQQPAGQPSAGQASGG